MGKTPHLLLAVAHGCLAALDRKDTPLERAPAAHEAGLSSPSSTERNPAPRDTPRVLPRRRRLEGSRLLNYASMIVAARPFGPSAQGSSRVSMLVATSYSATGKWPPTCTATFPRSVHGREKGSSLPLVPRRFGSAPWAPSRGSTHTPKRRVAICPRRHVAHTETTPPRYM